MARLPERRIGIDALKTVALCAIVLAHVGTGRVVFQLRNFDVPLMVLCSGALYASSPGGRLPWRAYVGRRLPRLVVPSWVFLAIFFAVTFAVDGAAGRAWPYGPATVAQEFLFRSRVIGLWIIRVFILVALAAPAVGALHRAAGSTRRFLGGVLLCYGLYELAFSLAAGRLPSAVAAALGRTLFEMVPYGCVFALGIVAARAPRARLIAAGAALLAAFALAFLVAQRTGGEIWTQEYKYPPRAYYLSYALGVSLVLFGALRDMRIDSALMRGAVAFTGSATLWIYLWHWLFLYYGPDLLRLAFGTSPGGGAGVAALYAVVLAGAVLATLLQRILLAGAGGAEGDSSALQRFIRTAFLR